MKVHFITSRPTLDNDINILRHVINIIHNSSHSLTHDWIEHAYKREIQSKQPASDWNLIYKENLEAIARSDVVIAEASYENFGVGYQVATAVQQKKPVLMLRRKTADKNAFATGVEEGWVLQKDYDDKDIEEIVKSFLEDNDIQAKDMRFNFFIDRQIYNYLRWAAFKTGKTKAEILRELVVKEIENREN